MVERYRSKLKNQPDRVRIMNMLAAVAMCQEHAGGKRRVTGTITCPLCSNTLMYSVSSNGHIHGVCKTKGCLQWMQ
jgi:hypothetical protein